MACRFKPPPGVVAWRKTRPGRGHGKVCPRADRLPGRRVVGIGYPSRTTREPRPSAHSRDPFFPSHPTETTLAGCMSPRPGKEGANNATTGHVSQRVLSAGGSFAASAGPDHQRESRVEMDGCGWGPLGACTAGGLGDVVRERWPVDRWPGLAAGWAWSRAARFSSCQAAKISQGFDGQGIRCARRGGRCGEVTAVSAEWHDVLFSRIKRASVRNFVATCVSRRPEGV